jgi:hypothetical protein
VTTGMRRQVTAHVLFKQQWDSATTTAGNDHVGSRGLHAGLSAVHYCAIAACAHQGCPHGTYLSTLTMVDIPAHNYPYRSSWLRPIPPPPPPVECTHLVGRLLLNIPVPGRAASIAARFLPQRPRPNLRCPIEGLLTGRVGTALVQVVHLLLRFRHGDPTGLTPVQVGKGLYQRWIM